MFDPMHFHFSRMPSAFDPEIAAGPESGGPVAFQIKTRGPVRIPACDMGFPPELLPEHWCLEGRLYFYSFLVLKFNRYLDVFGRVLYSVPQSTPAANTTHQIFPESKRILFFYSCHQVPSSEVSVFFEWDGQLVRNRLYRF